MKKKIKVAGCVTLYNSDEKVFDSVNTYIEKIDRLYVIDNTPERDIKKQFEQFKKIVYVPNKENLGVATALNIACNLAIKDGFDFILTMDQDSEFQIGEVDKLIKYVNTNNMTKIGIVSPWHELNRKKNRPSIEVEEMIEVMTSGNLLNLNIYKKIGGFLDDYFIDCVDIEYCMRLNKFGYKVLRLNYCTLNHKLGEAKKYKIGKREVYTSNHNYIRKYYITRNTLAFYKEYKQYFKERCDYFKRGISSMIRKVIIFEDDKFRKLRSIYRGYKDYKKGIFGKYPYKN